jgi:hypothetical protein
MEGRGAIPTLEVDDFKLSDVDLIMLDIEGSEFRALRGAEATIRRCRPLIVFEDKGLGAQFYGEKRDAAMEFVRGAFHYKIICRHRNDSVMGPA